MLAVWGWQTPAVAQPTKAMPIIEIGITSRPTAPPPPDSLLPSLVSGELARILPHFRGGG
jgi:hypothetical protein